MEFTQRLCDLGTTAVTGGIKR